MVVVCAKLPAGGLDLLHYTENPLGTGVPPWGSPLEWAMRIATINVRELKRPSWIEDFNQPASFPTIKLWEKRQFDDPFGSQEIH
jgi:hypothetical protein